MIIRILGEGQYEVTDDRIDELNALDDALQTAVETGDTDTFAGALAGLLAAVRRLGDPVPDSVLTTSEFVLPAGDAELDAVRALLGDEGLIPG